MKEQDNTLVTDAPLKVLVAGAGAVGGFYGGHLARAGAQVSVVCRSDLDTVKHQGFEIKTPSGDFHFSPHSVLADCRESAANPPDLLMVTWKALPGAQTALRIAPAIGPATTILLLQNGVGIEEPVANAFPHNEILSGLAFVCLFREGPGRIRHLDYGRLVLGRYPSGPSPMADRLTALFRQAGISCETSLEVGTARWRKLLWNAPFNPLSVLGRQADTSEIMALPQTAALAREIMEEVRAVAAASGHPLPPEAVEKNLRDTERMTPYRTSMLNDALAGRPLEVDAILGHVVRLGHTLGIPVPRLETLHALLLLWDRNQTSP